MIGKIIQDDREGVLVVLLAVVAHSIHHTYIHTYPICYEREERVRLTIRSHWVIPQSRCMSVSRIYNNNGVEQNGWC